MNAKKTNYNLFCCCYCKYISIKLIDSVEGGGKESSSLQIQINASNEGILASAISLVESLISAVTREVNALTNKVSSVSSQPLSTDACPAVTNLIRGAAAIPFVYPNSDGIIPGPPSTQQPSPHLITTSSRIKDALKAAAMRNPVCVDDPNPDVSEDNDLLHVEHVRKKRCFQEADIGATESKQGIGCISQQSMSVNDGEYAARPKSEPWMPNTIRLGLLMRDRKEA